MDDNDGFDWGGGQQQPVQGYPQQDNSGWGEAAGGMWGQTSGVDTSDAWDAPQSAEVWSDNPQQQSWTDPTVGAQGTDMQPPLQEVSGAGGKQPMPIPMLIGIAAAVLIVVALVLVFFANTGVKKKSTPAPQQTTAASTQTPTQQHTSAGSTTLSSKDGSVLLTKIPDSTALNYSGEVLQTTGTVGSKVRYLMDNQVVYCIELQISVGSVSQTVYFYCNYATYTSVSTGELVSIQYQQVQDNFISVNSVTK